MESNKIHWSPGLELYFKRIGEKAYGLSLLHKEAEQIFYRRTVYIDLPVGIVGSINGAVSIGSDSIFGKTSYSGIVIGVIALLLSILTFINTYFSWGRRAECHRIASISYSKLHRYMAVEMGLRREERMTAADLLNFCRQEYDRLAETSPPIEKKLISAFNEKFKEDDVSKPECTNGLEKIEIYEM